MANLFIGMCIGAALAFASMAVAVLVHLMRHVGHCWLHWKRHEFAWKPRRSEHQLFDYQSCTRCGWPGSMREIERAIQQERT